MSKRQDRNAKKPEKELTPITVYVTAFVLGVLGYLAGEFVLGNNPHPLHWLAGIAGIAFGYFLGWAICRRRGDIFGF